MPDCLTARVARSRPWPAQAQTGVCDRTDDHAMFWTHADPVCAHTSAKALCTVDRGSEGSNGGQGGYRDRGTVEDGIWDGARGLKERRNEWSARERE